MTHTNGATMPPKLPRPLAGPALALDELDAWDSEIAALDQAMRDAQEARELVAWVTRAMDTIEAQMALAVEGRNEGERKHRLTLALDAHEPYQGAVLDLQEARQRLADAERRIAVSKERCRLLQTAITLLVQGTPPAV